MMKEESMKKFIIVLIALFTIVGSVFSMSYEHARSQALFLTDKMAYELNRRTIRSRIRSEFRLSNEYKYYR